MTFTFHYGELRQVLREHVQSSQPELLANLQNQMLTYPDWLGSGYKRDIDDLPSGIDLTLHRYRLHKDLVQVLGSSETALWMEKISPARQGRVFAANALVLHVVSAGAALMAGPIADQLLEPAMVVTGPGVPVLGALFGSGPGAGMAILYVFCALAMVLVGMSGFRLDNLVAIAPHRQSE